MKQHNALYGYALLLVLTSTLPSCFIFHRHKSVTKNSTDSTAYTEIDKTILKKQDSAWDTYKKNVDSNTITIDFEPDTANAVFFDTKTGVISVFGRVGTVSYSGKKEAMVKDTGSKQSVDSTSDKQKDKTELKKENSNTNVDKERNPDYLGYFKIAAVLALVVFVVVKWQWIKAKVVDLGRGVFTRFFH